MESEFRLNGVQLSKAGKELYSVVDKSSQPEYTQALVDYLETQKICMININEKT